MGCCCCLLTILFSALVFGLIQAGCSHVVRGPQLLVAHGHIFLKRLARSLHIHGNGVLMIPSDHANVSLWGTFSGGT